MKNVYSIADSVTIEAEARQWLIKFDSDIQPSQSDIEALQDWCNRSPGHREEFIRIAAFWDDADLLTKFAIPLKASDSRLFNRSLGRLLVLILPVKRTLVMSGALAMVAAAFLVIPLIMNSDLLGNRTFTTAIGEQLTRTLNDGSTIQLNTSTQLVIEYSDSLRKIHLLKGEAHFDVASNPDRPFEVYAGQGLIRAVGTAFAVNLKQQGVEVIVSEGRVALATFLEDETTADFPRVDHEGAASTSPESTPSPLIELGMLESGQIATFNQAIKQVEKLNVVELNRELAWRKGILEFNGTPLSEVIAEVSRYSPLAVEITDPQLKNFKIGGRFKVGELEALFDVLESNFGVEVSRLDAQHYQLSQAKNG